MAALLALQKHKTAPRYSNSSLPDDIDSRVAQAVSFLDGRLQRWDVEASEQIGFEILIPAILDLLEQSGICFEFRGRRLLFTILGDKMKKFDPEILYGTAPSTPLHSLEAFYDKVDFNRLSHHKVAGSMMASPSSTAAYLMQCSPWDNDAEAYLRSVLASGDGSGGVPGIYPCPIFDLTWVVTTLVAGGFSADNLGLESIEIIADFLQRQLADQKGIIGFGPNVLPDADDTAKTVLCLNLLGRPVSPAPMIATFQSTDHFKSYFAERTSSLSANCNVLDALVHVDDPTLYSKDIMKATQFLCDTWSNGLFRDKWNSSPQYPIMLFAQAMSRLLRLWDIEEVSGLLETLMRDQVPVVLMQMAIRTLHTQSSDGSWAEGSLEVTAYAVLTLASIASLPWMRPLLPYIEQAFKARKKLLMQNSHRWDEGDRVWIGKVSYSFAVLSHTYCLAAVRSSISAPNKWDEASEELSSKTSLATVTKLQRFYSRLPIFAQESEWKLVASLVEGYLFLPQLRRIRHDIFPRNRLEEDKYLEYIPFTWTASNNLRGAFVQNSVLWDMMVISMLNYQADEYMEEVVGKHLGGYLEPVKVIIRRLCSASETTGGRATSSATSSANGQLGGEMLTFEECSSNPDREDFRKVDMIAEVDVVLTRFTDYVLQHPRVTQASLPAQRQLRRELEKFLLAHIMQAEDNRRFTRQLHAADRTTQFSSPTGSYFDWVQTTSANHTSCPMSLALFTCLITKPGQDFYQGVKQTYLAEDLSRHLGSMCRQQNDYGSILRDRAEKNLNSINFPEFVADVKDRTTVDDVEVESRIKANLYWLAEYERDCVESTFRQLEEQLGPAKTEVLRVFVDTTNLYGQIYAARDITR